MTCSKKKKKKKTATDREKLKQASERERERKKRFAMLKFEIKMSRAFPNIIDINGISARAILAMCTLFEHFFILSKNATANRHVLHFAECHASLSLCVSLSLSFCTTRAFVPFIFGSSFGELFAIRFGCLFHSLKNIHYIF